MCNMERCRCQEPDPDDSLGYANKYLEESQREERLKAAEEKIVQLESSLHYLRNFLLEVYKAALLDDRDAWYEASWYQDKPEQYGWKMPPKEE